MDEEDRYWTRPTISLKNSEGTKPQSATNESTFDRPSWITQRARKVFGSYRKDDFADPDVFLISLGVILEKYPNAVIHEATEPSTGIQSHSKFPPSIAEVKEYCEELKRRATYASDWDAHSRKQLNERDYEPRVRDRGPPPGESYEEMFAKHGRPTGAFEQGREFVYGTTRRA